MKMRIILTIFILLCLLVSFQIKAQHNQRSSRAERNALQKVIVFNGLVSDWANNEDYVYDGFYLQTNSQKLLVKFPPYMATQVKNAVKTGSNITVNGVEKISEAGTKEIMLVSMTVDDKHLYYLPPTADNIRFEDEFISNNGKITTLQKNQSGKVEGFILDDKIILRVPRQIAEQLSAVAIVGANVSYVGLKKALANGEVPTGTHTIINCQTITIKGIQYLTM